MSLDAYFQDAEARGVDLSGVFRIAREECERIWDVCIESGKRHFFELTDACWLLPSKGRVLCNWQEAESSGGVDGLKDMLSKVKGFDGRITYCRNRISMVSAPWDTFCAAIDGFLEFHDDTAIVLNEAADKALLFGSSGHLFLVCRG